ncbi:MAG: hypothetical protein IKB80_06375 [Oscillospiraceae bacterium]|nr:hypothetical protein [Oscillospiraceae bacterium]
MAKQHFYSRVPAKMSMYNRSDSYDTYAHSQGLEREFIEKELAGVYTVKLSKADLEAARMGLLPRVYSQSCLRSGLAVQTCVTYLPRDYTGERSAYLCHNLILTPQERETLCRGSYGVLNPGMFPVLSGDFLSGEQVADGDYPEIAYVPIPAEDPKPLTERYDPEFLEKFMYAILAVFFAKGKTVYFKLPCDDTQVSEEAVKFLSAVMTVIPRRTRENLSFVTYVTDAGQYPAAKIKCVAAQCPEIPAAKGAFFDFATGLATGLPTADVMAKAPVEFFCALLADATAREAFLQFTDRAMETLPKLDKLNMKTLSELVFLFAGASGLYPQQTVLPDDTKVYDLLCVYEKYRDALSQESRKSVYGCLERYPRGHIAIPKNIFAKLSKLYPGEPDAVKRMAMDVVLELIHTDIMREKLFTFLKNNYDGENPEIRAVIAQDLCRVFYGGFLKNPILTFFREQFAHEPENIRDAVFEKLMLTIRTEAVQQQILDFLAEHYAILTAWQKDLFYATFLEMLPEADALAAKLVAIVDVRVAGEPAELQDRVQAEITRLLDAPGVGQENPLLAVLCREDGFCCDTVTALVFGRWQNREIFDGYLQLLDQKPVVARTASVFRIHRILCGIQEAPQSKLIAVLDRLFAGQDQDATLYRWLEADKIAEEKLATDQNAFAYLFQMRVIHPAVANALTDVFDIRLGREGLHIVRHYAENNPGLLATEQYKVIRTFIDWQEAVERKELSNVFLSLKQLPREEALRATIAGYVRACLLDKEGNGPYQRVLYDMSACYLERGTLLSETAYAICREQMSQPLFDQMKSVKAVKEGACRAAGVILDYLAAACHSGAEFSNLVCDDENGLQMLLTNFAADYGSGADKWVLSRISAAPAPFVSAVRKVQNSTKPAGGSVWAKLFHRK